MIATTVFWFVTAVPASHAVAATAAGERLQITRSPGWQVMPFALRFVVFVK
jgi:hypothetical protein